MFNKIKEFVKNSRLAQGILLLFLGMAIGAIFYPTKRIEERERHKYEEETKTLKEQHSKEMSSVQEKYDQTSKELTETKIETERKITKLTYEIKDLKSKQKTAYYKVVRPDGTVEIKKFSETEVTESTKVITQIQDEFKQKVDSIEKKWEEKHKERITELKKEFASKEEEYKHKLDEFEKSKVVEINKKSFGIEAGALLNGAYYGHATYDVVGPFFIGLHTQLGLGTNAPPATAGGGIGIRF